MKHALKRTSHKKRRRKKKKWNNGIQFKHRRHPPEHGRRYRSLPERLSVLCMSVCMMGAIRGFSCHLLIFHRWKNTSRVRTERKWNPLRERERDVWIVCRREKITMDNPVCQSECPFCVSHERTHINFMILITQQQRARVHRAHREKLTVCDVRVIRARTPVRPHFYK